MTLKDSPEPKRIAAACLCALMFCVGGSRAAGQQGRPGQWVASWGAAQQIPEPQNALPPQELRDATLRQVVHLSAAGSSVRLHLSNAFGTAPLHLAAVHIARPISAAQAGVDPASDRAVLFSGAADVTIPAGAEYISDPVAYPVQPLSDLAISIYLDAAPEGETGHPGSRATSYLLHGNAAGTADLAGARRFEHWYFISGVDVQAAGAAVVALGDSITDGHAATTNGNDRWPDVLARRLQADPKTKALGVVNVGIGGNRILLDGLGPNALARFDRDALARTGAQYVLVLEGINDLGTATRLAEISQAEHDALVRRITAAFGQMIERAHAHGLKIYGATITPDVGSDYYHPGPMSEADRQAINDWIRAAGHFDAVVDFDKVVRDPQHPERLLPAFDSGDHLHPSVAGYEAMGSAIPLSLFGGKGR